jgi:hypothetical protein
MESAIISGSEVDLFNAQPVQNDIISGQWVQHHAQDFEALSGPLTFNIDGDDQYVDLNSSFLKVTARIVDTRPGKTPMADLCMVAPANNWLHSLFSQITMTINGRAVTQTHNNYHYKAYMENLLSYGTDARKTYLQGEGFYKDTAGHLDEILPANKGFKYRQELSKNSRMVELKGRLHLDMFNQPHLLLNHTPVRITLDRSKQAMVLMALQPLPGDADDLRQSLFAMEVTAAVLEVRKVTLSPPLVLSHINALNTTTAKYPIRRTVPYTVNIPAGSTCITQTKLLGGQLPRRVTLGFVSSRAYSGRLELNPFNFQNFNVQSLQLTAGGVPHPAAPMKFNYDPAVHQYLDGYMSLFIGTGQYGSDEGNMITREEYPRGFTLYCFNMTPDLNYEDEHYSGAKTGNLSVSVDFKEPLAETVILVCLAEFDNTVELDRYRQISMDYAS